MSHRILVIDPGELVWKRISEALGQAGDRMDYAGSETAAMTLLSMTPYDVLLLCFSGAEDLALSVLRRIREAGHHAEVVLLTWGDGSVNAVEAMHLGVVDLIDQPDSDAGFQTLLKLLRSRMDPAYGSHSGFGEHLAYAKRCIREKRLDEAAEALKRCLALNADAPEPHNLIGVIAEMRGDLSTAGKHYRAACALDPTYRPADANLRRMTDFNYSLRGIALDDGREQR